MKEAQEKAKELFHKFWIDNGDEVMYSKRAIKCALICVDETIKVLKKSYCSSNYISCYDAAIEELEEVKKEIHKI